MGLKDRLKRGLSRSRAALNEIFYMGGEVDDAFWDDLEDTLVMGDMGAEVAISVTDDLREQAARENLTRAGQLREALARRIASEFATAERDPFSDLPSVVLFVGINGAGKTTTVGKLANVARRAGTRTLIGGAEKFLQSLRHIQHIHHRNRRGGQVCHLLLMRQGAVLDDA